MSTYKTFVAGDHLLIGEGRTRRYHGLIPKISLAAVLSIILAQAKLDRMAKRLPIEAPWTVCGLFCGDLTNVSFLNLLFLIRSAGSINTLFSITGGYQENLIEGGAGSIARRVAMSSAMPFA